MKGKPLGPGGVLIWVGADVIYFLPLVDESHLNDDSTCWMPSNG